jgi:hypothetical protein
MISGIEDEPVVLKKSTILYDNDVTNQKNTYRITDKSSIKYKAKESNHQTTKM